MFLPSFFSSNPLSSPGALRAFLHQSMHIPAIPVDVASAKAIGVLETYLWELKGRDALEIQTIAASIHGIDESAYVDAGMPDMPASISLAQFDRLVFLKSGDRIMKTDKTWAEDSELMRIVLLRNGLYLQADPRTGTSMYSDADRGSDLTQTYPVTFDHVRYYGFWLDERDIVDRKIREQRARMRAEAAE